MILRGLRANDLLGWLAAVGVSRILDAPLRWTGGLADVQYDCDDIVDRLFTVCKEPLPFVEEFKVRGDLAATFLAEDVRKKLKDDEKARKKAKVKRAPGEKDAEERMLNGLSRSAWVEFAAQYPEWAAVFAGDTGGALIRSPLLMSKGGGCQGLFGMVQTMTEGLEADDISSALHGPWKLHLRGSLRFSSTESGEHANQWVEPTSDDTPRSPWGAYMLALHAFPALPCSGRTHPIAQGRIYKGEVSWKKFVWPVWDRYCKGRSLSATVMTTTPSYQCDRIPGQQGNYSISVVTPYVASGHVRRKTG